MAAHLDAVCFDADDPESLARFWSGVLGWSLAQDPVGAVALLPDDDTGFRLRFQPTDVPRNGRNQMHVDLTSSSPQTQDATVARALERGASHVDVGQRPEEEHVVLADPEGNEFCVIEAGNGFLAGCGRLGALASDGTQAVGYFWRDALGWPLVWDQDEETAIQSPHGGPKITWGGPPLDERPGRTRLHLDLAASPGTDRQAEVERLVALGARRLGGEPDQGWVTLQDPDGNEFRLLGPSAGLDDIEPATHRARSSTSRHG